MGIAHPAHRCMLALLVSLATPDRTDACTCGRQGPVCQEFWIADAVFVARVESVTRTTDDGAFEGMPSRVVTFTVAEPFSVPRMDADQGRGTRASADHPSGTVSVRTASSSVFCGYPFRVGREYLVYASAAEGSSELTTGRCSRTRPIERAASDLQYLRSLGSAAASSRGGPTGRISGNVILRTRDLARRRDRDRGMAGVVVALTNGEVTTRVTTDGVGAFAARGVPPGSYQASVELPPGVVGSIAPASFELKDARACAEISAVLRSDVRIRGRVVDSSRRPVPGITVDLTVSAGLDRAPGPERMRSLTRADGTFELAGVPPGRFVIGINTDPGSTPLVLYPGVDSLEDAATVTVRAGADLELDDLVVPEHTAFVQIPGVVLDAAGVPAEGARVFLAGPFDGDHILGEPAVTDQFGRFVLSAAAGQQYKLFAERARASGRSSRVDASDSVLLTVSAATHPFQKLRLRPLH